MTDNRKYIVKNKPLSKAQDMDALKAEGIQWSKQLSGDIWTDYNDHDPGVTVLENLCSVITEMSFKATELDFEQLFFAKNTADSKISLEDYFLLKQEEVLYSNPITLLDYRKLLLDYSDEYLIKNIWVNGNTDNTYNIYVQSKKEVNDVNTAAIQAYYNQYRNFGEKCKAVIVLNPNPVQNYLKINNEQIENLSADIVVNSIVQFIEDIKAYIEPQIRYAKSVKKLNLQEDELNQINQGPVPIKKFIHPEDLVATSLGKMKTEIDIAAFIAQNTIKWNNLIGIENEAALSIPRLQVLEKKIAIFDEEKFIATLPPQIQSRVRADYKKKSIKPLLNGKVEWDTYLPQSNLLTKDLADYYSIQYTFPQYYNLGLEDISMLLSNQQKQIQDLQAYLLLFESLMVDFLVKLISFPELLKINRKSNDEKIDVETYFSEILKNIPGNFIQNKEAQIEEKEASIKKRINRIEGKENVEEESEKLIADKKQLFEVQQSLIEDKDNLKKIYKKYSFTQNQQIRLREYALDRYGENFNRDLIKKAWGEANYSEGKWLKKLHQLIITYKAYCQGRHNSFNLNDANADFPLSQKLSILLNQEYDINEPNIYIIEASLINDSEKKDDSKEKNPFKVAIVINISTLPIEGNSLNKRQNAIIELIKEELPFHLSYSNFLFLSEKKGQAITKIEEVFSDKEENGARYLNKKQFIKIYKEWRKYLAKG